MNILMAKQKDLEIVKNIVQTTIWNIYPKYYPNEVVMFFSELHETENIAKDIQDGNVWLLEDNGVMPATGTLIDNHITRVFVLPDFQKRGYGSKMMDFLEGKVLKNFDKAVLDASLPASSLYEARGYLTASHGKCEVRNSKVLIYEIMEKLFDKSAAALML